MAPLFLFFFFLVISGWTVYRMAADLRRGRDRSILPRVNAEFRQLLVVSEHPQFCFDGRRAQIMDEREQYLGGDGAGQTLVSVQRYARNDHGEYFFFLSEGTGKPVFRHVPQQTAKAVLKKKYIAPGAPL